ncbi:FAD-dependent oxidoreductase [Segnochrobactraceae bacterium EtOH-i3]
MTRAPRSASPGAPDTALACDVLVIGSGASGLSAAVTAAHHGLSVIVAEKEPVFGGTTAISGGWLWIPRNPLAVAAGIREDIDGPLAYLRSEMGPAADSPRVRAFLTAGPEMVSFFAANSAIEWIDGNGIPDFHESPGALAGGRSVSVAPFDGRRLGEWLDYLRPPLKEGTVWGMAIQGGAEMRHFFNATRDPASARVVARRLARYGWQRLRHGRDLHLVNGNALVARLMRSALDKGVRLLRAAPALSLTRAGDRVTGAVLSLDGRPVSVTARRGVVLAAGGFPHDRARLARLVPHAGATGAGHQSAAPRGNSGDGLRLGESVGGVVADDLVSATAMAPVSLVPQRDGSARVFPHLVERAKPGIIAVTPDGRRFVNEADSYYDFQTALLKATPAGAEPVAWLIADRRALRRWGLGAVRPFPFPVGPAIRAGYLRTGRTLADLARVCGIDAATLEASVARFNAGARAGEDPDFHRGASRYNHVQGDGGHRPNPSLGPLETGPFYAVRLVPGSLGTFAGLRTDASARVLDRSGAPIPGLFSVGNDMNSIMNGRYPSGGITLGPAMTFGYIAGRTLAGHENKTELEEGSNELLRAGNP